MRRLGKQTVLFDNYQNGSPTIAMTNTIAVYQRNDGSYFIHDENHKRCTIVKRDDDGGTFYLRSDFD